MNEIDDLKKCLQNEITDSKKSLNSLMQTKIDADRIGYKTIFAMEDLEESLQNTFNTGYSIGEKDGYIDALNKILQFLEK